MRVLFIYFRYPLYPKGSYFQEFLNKLAEEEEIERIYLIATRYPKGTFKKAENIKIFWIPFLKLRFLEDIFFMITSLFRTIFTRDLHKVDLVNTIGPRGLLAGWYLKKIYGVPFIWTIEMLNEKGYLINNIYYEIVRFLMRKAPIDKFICWSSYYWEKYLKKWGVPKDRMVIIPGGVNTEVYNPAVDGSEIKKKYASDKPLIVFAKPLYYPNTEMVKILVQAAALMKYKIQVKLLIGTGEGKKEIQKLAKTLGIENYVEFMPPIPFTQIPKYIAAADLIVLPFTYTATTSRSLLESMAMGKPVITTRVGEIENIVEDGKEAVLVNPVEEEVAEAIERVFADQVLAESLGRNAFALIKHKYSISIIVNKTIEVYEGILSPVKDVKSDFGISRGEINEK